MLRPFLLPQMLQVKKLAAYIDTRSSQGTIELHYEAATVTRVTPVGMGDRVCVDLCSMMAPGEGLLVGSFSRALFLVHSECMESAYINSRPFRVNAGAVSKRAWDTHRAEQSGAARSRYPQLLLSFMNSHSKRAIDPAPQAITRTRIGAINWTSSVSGLCT